jgi:hypothetical protein
MRRFVATILAASMAACLASACGSSPSTPCAFPTIANKLLGKTWVGQLSCGSTTRLARFVFSQKGCNVVVNGQSLIYNGVSFPSFPASGPFDIDPQTGAFNPKDAPVTINGNQATFSPELVAANPSGNKTTSPQAGILIVPGTTFTATYTVAIADTALNGTYSSQQLATANQQGTVCFSPETVPTADVSGHWTGTMSATSNASVGAGTLDFALAMNGSLVDLASPGALTTSEVTVLVQDPTGVSGIVIGNSVLFGITWIRTRTSSGQSSDIQHRWLLGTISGNTIAGEFSDAINPIGQGTFTIAR